MLDDLSRTLRFKPHLLLLDDGPETLYIVDEFKRSILSGALLPALAACVRDGLTIAQTAAALTPRFSERDIFRALDHFVQRGYLRADEADSLDATRSFHERTGLDGDTAVAASAAIRVEVQAYGVDPLPQIEALRASGVTVEPQAPLVVALCDSYTHPELLLCAERTAARGAALLLVSPVGVQACIGPLLSIDASADSPCIACIRYWIGLNRPVQALLARRHGERAARLPAAYSAASLRTVAAFAATFVEQINVNPQRRLHAATHLFALRTDTFDTQWHRVLKRPQCPCCGNAAWMREQAFKPQRLASAPVHRHNNGGYRGTDAQSTFERYRHLVSPLTGPIAYLHPMPGRNAGSRYVYVAGYLVCPRGPARGNRFDRICSGKGSTEAQARVSALCETLERFSGVFQGDEATVRGSMAQLQAAAQASQGAEPIHPNTLQQYSERQFDEREAINATTDDVRKQVPERFDTDAVIDWTPAWSLSTDMQRLVPLSYCFTESPDTEAARFCVHNPNGSAAGASFEEAVLQGLLELVERDAVAIWWYNRIERPGVRLDSFREPYFDTLQREYAAMGWQLWALDITHDLHIPTFVALARQPESGRFSIGFGCHLDPRIALQRALTEVNQLLDVAAAAPPPWDSAKLADDRFLFPCADLCETDAGTWPRLGGVDLKADVEHCIARFASFGMETLVVNKTRPDIGLPVVQTIVPGLCHFWPRFGAPRLYAVPVGEGWLDRARDETELNRALLFL